MQNIFETHGYNSVRVADCMLLHLAFANAYISNSAAHRRMNKLLHSGGLGYDISAGYAKRMAIDNIHTPLMGARISNDIDFTARPFSQRKGSYGTGQYIHYGPIQAYGCEPGIDDNCHVEDLTHDAMHPFENPEMMRTYNTTTYYKKPYNHASIKHHGMYTDNIPVSFISHKNFGLRGSARLLDEHFSVSDKIRNRGRRRNSGDYSGDKEHGRSKHMYHMPLHRDYIGHAYSVPELTLNNGTHFSSNINTYIYSPASL